MSDDVRRIEHWAFSCCDSLVFVRLSRNLEYMGTGAFLSCRSLNSMFIPPSCTEIGDSAFEGCEKLIILSVPENTQLGNLLIVETELWNQWDMELFDEDLDDWLDFLNGGFEDYDEWLDFPDQRENSLHRICCSTNEDEAELISEQIYQVLNEEGPQALLVKNKIGVTPLQYLNMNPYLQDIDEMNLLRRKHKSYQGELIKMTVLISSLIMHWSDQPRFDRRSLDAIYRQFKGLL